MVSACLLLPPIEHRVSLVGVSHSDSNRVRAGGLKTSTLQGPDQHDDRAPDVPLFLHGDQHHTSQP